MSSTATTTPTIAPGSTRNCLVSFAGQIAESGDERLTGTPTVAVAVSSGSGAAGDLTVSGEGLNAAAERVGPIIGGTKVAALNGAAFRVALSPSAVIGTVYKLTVTCATDGGQTLKGFCLLEVSE